MLRDRDDVFGVKRPFPFLAATCERFLQKFFSARREERTAEIFVRYRDCGSNRGEINRNAILTFKKNTRVDQDTHCFLFRKLCKMYNLKRSHKIAVRLDVFSEFKRVRSADDRKCCPFDRGEEDVRGTHLKSP